MTARAIAAGFSHTCALTMAGAVECWGSNGLGQLGSKTAGWGRPIPVGVTGLSSGVAAIAAGGRHTCALTTAGGVKCWGHSYWGQLGDGKEGVRSRATPVGVLGLSSGVTAIAAGFRHTCALTTAGGIKCWGEGWGGQLGEGHDWGTRYTPVGVVGLSSGVKAITAGKRHTCALTNAGAVKCWGRTLGGGLRPPETLRPTGVPGLSRGVRAVAAGDGHTCALTTNGAVKCWGLNTAGQLGDGTSGTDRRAPVAVASFGETP
jgi:alpha-tubulin suppressor-like RCC1 family protein